MSKLSSMTGFAGVETKIGQRLYKIELRSLNHRFLDLKLRLPRELASIEPMAREFLQKRFSRGSMELKIDSAPDPNATQPEFQTNVSVAAHYYENLTTLQKTLGLKDTLKTADLLAYPDVITRKQLGAASLENEGLWRQFQPHIEKVANQLGEMRETEGRNLRAHLSEKLRQMESKLEEVRGRKKELEPAYEKQITKKIDKLFELHPLVGVDQADKKDFLESRIAQELALILDRRDIEEEMTRLRSHLDQMLGILEKGGLAGRKLEFLLQETNREINTLGNKAQDYQLSQEVVALKVLNEQLREQILNIE